MKNLKIQVHKLLESLDIKLLVTCFNDFYILFILLTF